jgi:predicted nuclease of restriction endonuclease-like (RecB) superfamily
MQKIAQKKSAIERSSQVLLKGICKIVDKSLSQVAVFLNAETTMMYWSVGNFINDNLKENNRTPYGLQIVATVSQQLTEKYGKGFTYTALTRMSKVASAIGPENITPLSQQLSWSHLIELSLIEDDLKREFYTQKNIAERWGVRELRNQVDKMLFERTAIAKQPKEKRQKSIEQMKSNPYFSPDSVFKNTYVLDFLNLPHKFKESELENALVSEIEKFILELGSGFAFVERQKRISIDSTDYHLDLLFYHRKLKRLVAIDLKIGKFKPQFKAQMELYLRWLQKNEMRRGEAAPIGLLLCSQGNTEHIELLMLDNKEIKVAQYLTELPNKKWFAQKLHRAMEITQSNPTENKPRAKTRKKK